jgi:polygalacturonase
MVPFALTILTTACGGGGDAGTTTGGAGGTSAAGGTPGTGGGAAGGTPSAGGGSGGAAGGHGAAGAGGGGTAGAGGAAGKGTAGVTGAGGTAGAGSGGATGAGGTAGKGTGGGAAGAGGAAGKGGAGSGGSGGNAGAAGSSDPCGAANPAVVPLPTYGPGTFNVTSYGALGDGQTDDTSAIQAALTAAANAGGGTVVVPSGTFLGGPIVISSGTNLQLASGAVLQMLPMGSYTGSTAFITAASDAHDIGITGSGTIDGQGQAWWTAFAADSSVARPQEVSLGHVTRVQISGIKLQNSPEEHIWVKSDTDVTITGITISTLAVSGKAGPANTDGVDIGATGVFFCNNSIACGDDNVVMEGTNIYVAYSTFGVGHGCSIGSITESGVSAVTVDHVTFNGTTSGVRMKSARDCGGLVQNLTYSNLTMTNVQNPIYITSYYPTLPTDPTTDTAMAVTATTPEWENITLKNVTATGSSNAGILWGLPEAKISGLVFDNVRVAATTGMEIFHASGVSFTNGSTVTPKSGAAVTTYDAAVTGITTTAY